MTEDEMVGRHHWLSGREFQQGPGDAEGQGVACCSPCGHKESDVTERLNNNRNPGILQGSFSNLILPLPSFINIILQKITLPQQDLQSFPPVTLIKPFYYLKFIPIPYL